MPTPKIELTGHSLTLEDVINVARKGYQVLLDPAAVTFIERGAGMVRKWAESDKVIYGINTGFGDLSSVVISPENSRVLQENLLKSHACGVGEAFPEEIVRAIMLLRVNSLIRGFSGISLAPIAQIINFLNLGIHPVIPEQGSVGASGDLCPLSHLGIALLGMGNVIYEGEQISAMEALEKNGLQPVSLGPKEGLALNNGTAAMTAVGILVLADAIDICKTADIAGALSLEALHGVPYAFDKRTHELRPYLGQRRVASNMRKLIANSEIIEKFRHQRVQDAYSLRCIPQVHGASRDAIDYVKGKMQIEINSVTDNPLIFPSDMEAISGGNFHGQPIAINMDFLGIALSEIGNISERRVARMVDGKLSGLPPFLVKNSGLNSGFMIPQYTAAALVSENKVLSHPSSVDSIPTSANQEDHVSMGAYSSRKALQILKNVTRVISIELLTSAQALEFSQPLRPGDGTDAAMKTIRERIPFIEQDQYLHPYISLAIEMVEDSSLIQNVEKSIGGLF